MASTPLYCDLDQMKMYATSANPGMHAGGEWANRSTTRSSSRDSLTRPVTARNTRRRGERCTSGLQKVRGARRADERLLSPHRFLALGTPRVLVNVCHRLSDAWW